MDFFLLSLTARKGGFDDAGCVGIGVTGRGGAALTCRETLGIGTNINPEILCPPSKTFRACNPLACDGTKLREGAGSMSMPTWGPVQGGIMLM